MTPHKARVLAVGATADGRDVLSVAADGTLVRSRRDSRTAGRPTRVDFGRARPRAAVFSADGARLMTGGEFGDIRVFDVASGALKHELRGHTAEMMDLAAGPNPDVLASAGAEADMRLWDLASGTQAGFIDAELSAFALAFSPKDGTLASGGPDRRLTLRDPKTMAQIGMFVLPAPKMVAALAWSPDGRFIAVGDLDDETLRKGGLQIVDAASRESVATLDTGNAPARVIAFLSDGGLVGFVNRDLRAWNLAALK